jgi:rhodanese-related sulfurtransferase
VRFDRKNEREGFAEGEPLVAEAPSPVRAARVSFALRVIWLIVAWMVWPSNAMAASGMTQGAIATPPATRASMAHCGVRCLYAAARAEGLRLDGKDLVRPEYIGSREGSSIEELELAARDHGLHTFAFVDGTIGALRSATHPVILHVESVPGSGRYDHFVLYLGSRNSQLLVLDTVTDPGEPARQLSPRDIELIWDGTGLIISKHPIEGRLLSASVSQLMCWGGGIVGLIILVRRLLSRTRISTFRSSSALASRMGPVAEMLAIVTLSLLAPTVSAVCADTGLLAHKQQVSKVEQTHIAQFLRRISLAEAARCVASGSAVFVDARYAADYSNGHLPGAINLPVTASAGMVRACMAGVRMDVPVVVYCQSRGCPFSKAVAGELLQEGYSAVQLMDGGWQEWSAWKH